MNAESLSQEKTFHKRSMLCTVRRCWGHWPSFGSSLHTLYPCVPHLTGNADRARNSKERHTHMENIATWHQGHFSIHGLQNL